MYVFTSKVLFCRKKIEKKRLKTNFERVKILLTAFLFGFANKSAFHIKCPICLNQHLNPNQNLPEVWNKTVNRNDW